MSETTVTLDLANTPWCTAAEIVENLRAGGKLAAGWIADQIEAQTKPPKPAEPTGLGAVVEDSQGREWLRRVRDKGRAPWAHYDESERGVYTRDYDDINAVRVLSEGVPA